MFLKKYILHTYKISKKQMKISLNSHTRMTPQSQTIASEVILYIKLHLIMFILFSLLLIKINKLVGTLRNFY